MAGRKPTNDHFDAVVRFAYNAETGPYAFAVTKFNIGWGSSRLRFLEAEPLVGDPEQKNRDPKIPPFSDFWPYKLQTDVIVSGHAYAPGGRAASSFDAAIRVGERHKQVRVFGPRVLRVSNGQPLISAPEPVEHVSLGREEAYGGTDELVSVPAEPGSDAELALNFDHPGLYPRNEAGRGYAVIPDHAREVHMPSLENPRELLTPERAIVTDPHLWYRQPLPWYLGRTSLLDFPRMTFLGLDPWFHGPEDQHMPEVRRGELPPNYRQSIFPYVDDTGRDIRMRQAASYDLVLPEIKPGTPVSLENMHPEKPVLRFQFPSYVPRLDFVVDRQLIPADARLHHVTIYPEEERLTLVYGAVTELPRVFIPGIHKNIPLGVSIDGGPQVAFETPEAISDKLARSKQEGRCFRHEGPRQFNANDARGKPVIEKHIVLWTARSDSCR